MNTILKFTASNIFKRLLALLGLAAQPKSPVADSTQLQQAIEHADEAIEYARNLDDAVNACLQAMYAITAEIKILHRQLANVIAEFTEEYMAWLRVRAANRTPHVLPADLAKARRYKLAGIAATVLEIILATSVLLGFSVGFLPGLLVSTGITLLLLWLAHGAITGATDRPSPRHSRDLIHRRVFLPALKLVIPAVGIVLLARTLSGLSDTLLDILLPVLQLALGVATLGLVLLSGALFALADIYRWSLQYTQEYEQIERAIAELENKREYYRRVSNSDDGPEDPSDDDDDNSKPTSSLPPTACIALLLIFGGLLTGCDGLGKAPAAKASAPAPVSRPACFGAELHVRADRSGSGEPEATAAAAHNLHRQLPMLIKTIRAPRLTVGYFDENGWSIPVEVNLALPKWQAPSAATIQQADSELVLLQGLKQDVEARRQAARKAALEEADKKYEADLQKAVAELNPATFNPTVTKSAPCTDLYGLLVRLSKGPHSGKQLYVVVSDGYHSCGAMKPLAAPAGEVTVILLLTTANAKESQGKRADEQYQNREEALLQIAPWLKIVPGDQENLAAILPTTDNQQPTATSMGQ